MRSLLPPGWPRPSGYANGVESRGRLVFVAGQVGWDRQGRFPGDDFVAQVRQALSNVLAVLAVADGGPEHVTRLTWFVIDKRAYLARRQEIGAVYRELMGEHYPAMTLVEVKGLLEEEAVVEIEATAVIPDADD